MACPSRGLLSVASVGQVMALCLHPFIINQAFRHKYVDLALEFIAAQPDVWLTTSDDIAAHFRTVGMRATTSTVAGLVASIVARRLRREQRRR